MRERFYSFRHADLLEGKMRVAGVLTTHKCTIIIKQVNDGLTQKQPQYTKITAIHARQDHCFKTMSSHPANNAKDHSGNPQVLLGKSANPPGESENPPAVSVNAPDQPENPYSPSDPSKGGSRFGDLNKVLPVAIGLTAAGVAVAAVPIAVTAVGFGTGGIAAGSLAASLMSSAATSGIGMGAVATLQSVGAAGLAASTQILIGTAAGAAGAGIGHAAVAAAQPKEAPPGKDSKGNNPLTKPNTPHCADSFVWRSATGVGMGAVATLQSVGAAGLAASTQILSAAVAAAQPKEAPPGKDSKGNNPLTKPDTPHCADSFVWRSATGIGMGAVAALQSAGAAGLAVSSQILIGAAAGAAGLAASTQILIGTAAGAATAGISGAAVAAAQTEEAPPGKDSKGNNPLTKPDTPHCADGFGWRSATGIGMGAVAALQSVGAAGLAVSRQILIGTAAVAAAQTKEAPPGKDSKGSNLTEEGPGGDGSRGNRLEDKGPGIDGTREPVEKNRIKCRL